MNGIKNRYALFIISLISVHFFFLTACNNETAKEETILNETLKIVATTSMIKDAIYNVVKDKAELASIMGAGVDPHLYKATPSDLKLLRNADIIFYNGLHLEAKLGEILEKMERTKKVMAVTDGVNKSALIPLTVEEGGGYDPHVWFDVSLWQQVVQFINHQMKTMDTNNADFYQKNTDAYLKELKALDTKAKTMLGTIPEKQRILITSHDAFGYFGKAYQFKVEGLQGISTVAEFGLKDVKQMVDNINARKIKALFVESSVPAKPLEAVIAGCKQKGHPVKIGGTLFSDAMGKEGTPQGTYIGMINANLSTIVNALRHNKNDK